MGPKTLGVCSVLLALAGFAWSLRGAARAWYLPGPTTAGHHQIESECTQCHTRAFSDKEDLQAACERCHGAELAAAEDSHPERKFTDPRNASRVAMLDARFCITCHREHRSEQVSSMGLTLPRDYCYRCHDSIADDRPSHRGLAFDTCASAGCHRFHDNRSLYEDFLVRHAGEPKLVGNAVPERAVSATVRTAPPKPAPVGLVLEGRELTRWEQSAHARSGLGCGDCHGSAAGGSARVAVAEAACGSCHAAEREGFERGRHGMRLAVGLPPLRVADAQLPMHPAAGERSLGCTSCHGAHAFDTRQAAFESCVGCHDDEHVRNYKASPHAALWLADPSGRSGASCATCHLPRRELDGVVRVVHNQNDNLRPSDKMARDVCLHCHGLGFALDALSDPALASANFRGNPAHRGKSIEMATSRAHQSP